MGRFACLQLVDVPLAAALRAEPELRGRPLAITDGPTIVAGALRGLTVTQARAVRPELRTRPISLEGVVSAQEALVDAALSVTPRVQDTASGTVHLDLAGTSALFPTERGLLTAVAARLEDVGLPDVRAGTGPTRTVAELAARWLEGGQVVESSDTDRFLDPLPLDLLDPPEELFDRLNRWGIYTLGELRALPTRSIGARLGEEGVLLARRGRGEDLTPFRPSPPRLRFEESHASEYPLGDLERLGFVLRGVIDRLTRRLRVRGLAVRELLLELGLESGKTFARTVGAGAPTFEGPVLTSLIRLALEKDPPGEPVERVRAIATPGNVESAQLDLFLPPLPAPAELAVTVARLESLCGPGRVGAPGVENGYRLEAESIIGFELDTRRSRASAVRDAPLPRPAMALRAVRPPKQVKVWGPEGTPERIGMPRGNARVLERAGPWRLYGEWWGESRFARDYFDVELSDGGVYRIYHDLENESWFLDGIYD